MSYGINAPFGLVPFTSNNGSISSQKSGIYKIAASTDGTITYNQSLFCGDPVITNPKLNFIANGVEIGAGSIAPYIPISGSTVTNATLNPPLGVFLGCKYTDVNGNTQMLNKWVANTPILPGSQIIAYVNDDPNQLYSVQVSSSITDILKALITSQKTCNLNANLAIANGGDWTNVPAGLNPTLNPGSGNLSSGISGFYLDGSTIAKDATLPVKILGFDTNINNEKNYIYPIDPTTGAYAFANQTGTGGGFFLNVIVKFNVHAQGSNGTVGIVAAVQA